MSQPERQTFAVAETAAPANPVPERFLPTDRPDVPTGREVNSDAAWAEFQLLSTQSMKMMTEAAAQALLDAEAAANPAAVSASANDALGMAQPGDIAHGHRLEDVITLAESASRACLKPREWFYLYQLLLNCPRKRQDLPPPPPIEGLAWKSTSATAKKMCFHTHLEWAAGNGILELVASFLQELPEDRWLHLNNQ